MIPDPIERLEAIAERTAEVQDYEPSSDTMACAGCGKRFNLIDLHPAFAHPATPFLCHPCLDARYGPTARGEQVAEGERSKA